MSEAKGSLFFFLERKIDLNDTNLIGLTTLVS